MVLSADPLCRSLKFQQGVLFLLHPLIAGYTYTTTFATLFHVNSDRRAIYIFSDIDHSIEKSENSIFHFASCTQPTEASWGSCFMQPCRMLLFKILMRLKKSGRQIIAVSSLLIYRKKLVTQKWLKGDWANSVASLRTRVIYEHSLFPYILFLLFRSIL